MTKKYGITTQPGQFYGRRHDGQLEHIGPQLGDVPPDAWICRRVADFPKGIPPHEAAIGTCTQCQAEIAYNPRYVLMVPPDTPQICMQCAEIEPLPIPE